MKQIFAMNTKLLMLTLWLTLVSVAASNEYDIDWNVYKAAYGKSYDNFADEEAAKRAFYENYGAMEDFNKLSASKKLGWKKAINHMSDTYAWELFKFNTFDNITYSKQPPMDPQADLFIQRMTNSNTSDIPAELDWRKFRDRVSGVKDQGSDLTDWALAVAGVIEGQMVASRLHARLMPLSARNLVDCLPRAEPSFKHGNIIDTLEFIRLSGIMSEYSYEHSRVNSSCKYDPARVAMRVFKVAKITSKLDEELLKYMVARYGPVSAAICATKELFSYGSGVFIDPECITENRLLNRAVLIVGYGESKEEGKYWIIKNSWGRDWGEQGYFRLARGENNHCGIGTHIAVPYYD